MKFTTLKTAIAAAVLISTLTAGSALAADEYQIDTQGAHASINFKIDHLGLSYIVGRFNEFEGSFHYDADNPANNRVHVTINPASVDSNHAERDRHIRSDDYLDVSRYSQAEFVSSGYEDLGDGRGIVTGDLTLYGTTNEIQIEVEKYGEGEDPWGGYRMGFKGTTELHLPDFDMNFNLGPAAETVYMDLHLEGVRQ